MKAKSITFPYLISPHRMYFTRYTRRREVVGDRHARVVASVGGVHPYLSLTFRGDRLLQTFQAVDTLLPFISRQDLGLPRIVAILLLVRIIVATSRDYPAEMNTTTRSVRSPPHRGACRWWSGLQRDEGRHGS